MGKIANSYDFDLMAIKEVGRKDEEKENVIIKASVLVKDVLT